MDEKKINRRLFILFGPILILSIVASGVFGYYLGMKNYFTNYEPTPYFTAPTPKNSFLLPTQTQAPTLCIDHLGRPKDEQSCAGIPIESRSCRADSDCYPTCGYGCLSQWKQPSPIPDCEAVPTYTCGCVNNICQKLTGYSCPQSGWVNCMPILTEEGKKACSAEAIAWYKANCQNFKGIAQ